MTDKEKALLRLSALILPRRAETEAERFALDRAAEIQAEYEAATGEGVTSLSRSNDGVSVGVTRKAQPFGICRAAKDVLYGAGLLGGEIPTAKMI